jgi:hypothetical protein
MYASFIRYRYIFNLILKITLVACETSSVPLLYLLFVVCRDHAVPISELLGTLPVTRYQWCDSEAGGLCYQYSILAPYQ